MKKLICILLALCLLAALTGCVEKVESQKGKNPSSQEGSEQPANSICGTWQTEVNLADFINTEMCEYEALACGILVSDFNITVNLEFREDGTYRAWAEQESINVSLAELMGVVEEILWQDVEMMYMDPESDLTLEELMAKEGVDPNKDLEEIRTQLTTEGYVGKLKSRIDREGQYELVDDDMYGTELFLSKALNEEVDKNFCDIIQVEGELLTFVECYQDVDFDGGLLYPLDFQRVN